MSMDRWQERQTARLRKRRADQIREDALRIQEHIGYVIARLDKDRPDSVSQYAADMTATLGRLSRNAAALETLDEALAILATTDEEVSTP